MGSVVFWLVLSSAAAGDPQVVEAGGSITAEERSVLLSEPDFRSCWADRKNLPICEVALDTCKTQASAALESSATMLDKTTAVFDLALERFSEDERLVNECALGSLAQEREITDLRVKLQTARAQRNSAYAVAGALILGAASAVALSL